MKNVRNIAASMLFQRSGQPKSISARQYLNLSASEKGRIGSARVIAPKLGDASFGFIEVIYK